MIMMQIPPKASNAMEIHITSNNRLSSYSIIYTDTIYNATLLIDT